MTGWRDAPVTVGSDGLFHAKVTVGHKPNGQLDRRHRSGRTEKEVRDKLRELFRQLDAGTLGKAGRAPTVQEWFEHWLTEIAPHGRRALRPTTLNSYTSKARTWIYPHLGRLRLDTLEAESLDRLYAAMRQAGRSSGTILIVHSVLRRGLAVAQQRGRVNRNIAKMIDPPGSARVQRTPLPTDAVRALVLEAGRRRNGARWLLGLAIGPRQGETLGLCWPQVDLEAGTVEISWQLQRCNWQHGCAKPCGKLARSCPARHGGGLRLMRPKTWNDQHPEPRVVAVPATVLEALRAHRRAQTAERLAAGTAWRRFPHPDGGDADFVFRQVDGAPILAQQDWRELQSILDAAGLARARVHALRHTAATMLVDLGEDLAVIQQVLGHAAIATTRGYATVRTAATARAAAKMEQGLFGTVTDLVTERERRRSS